MTPAKRSAGVVVVRHFPTGRRYLLLRCYRYWDFPKGEIEAGEPPMAAAIREVREETGLADLDFRWGEIFIETPPYSHGKVARYYLAESRGGEVFLPVSPELGRPEHDEYRWLEFNDALALVNPRIRGILEWAEREGH